MNNQAVKRFEIKYLINDIEYHSLVNRLKYGLQKDKYSTPHKGYFIRSLYFDSFDDECFYEKLAGIQTRKKYRMRIYNVNDKNVKFEIKNKLNNQIFKETATISRESAEKIIEGNNEELLQYNNPILNKIYIKFIEKAYKPRVIVDYTRDAFIYDFFNVRITIDKNLRSNGTNLSLFCNKLHTVPFILEDKHVLEVKFNGYLPDYVKQLIQLNSFEKLAISKYILSRRYTKLYNWEDF